MVAAYRADAAVKILDNAWVLETYYRLRRDWNYWWSSLVRYGVLVARDSAWHF